MTYIINYADTTKTAFTIDPYRYDGPGSTDGQHSSLVLVGKGYSDYGQELWTNLLHMLENHSNTMPPQSPIEGQLWYDNSLVNNLKIYKQRQGGTYNWVDVVDTDTLQKLLYSSDYFSESILQADVRIPTGTTKLHGNVHITGKLEVDKGIFSYQAPKTDFEVVNLNFLNNKLTTITNKYVPLKSPPAGSTITGDLTVDGNFTVTTKGDLVIAKTPTKPTHGANKDYVDSQIKAGGVSWPTKGNKTVLVSPNGKDVAFLDITPEYICKTDLPIAAGSTNFNVIASDPTNERSYWKNLDESYVYIGSADSAEQEILGPKKINKLTLNAAVTAGSSTGTTGQVLTSQGASLPPIWAPVGGGNNNAASFAGMFDNGTNETVTVTIDGVSLTYQRGYSRLPNDLIMQWIIGTPIRSLNSIDSKFKTFDTYEFQRDTHEAFFFHSNDMPAPNSLMCKYEWKYPFSTINYTTVTSHIKNGIGLFEPSNSDYKLSDFGSSLWRACVTYHQSLDYQWRSDTPDYSSLEISPVIFALGTYSASPAIEANPTQYVFNRNKTWVVPSTAVSVTATLIGAGGGGAYGTDKNDWETGGAGGGSGGKSIVDLTPLKGQTIRIGVGTGGTSKLGTGGTGGDTYIKTKANSTDTTYTANFGTPATGGKGGTTVKDSGSSKGGLGGTPNGNAGVAGVVDKDSNTTAKTRVGKGGDSPLVPMSGGAAGEPYVKQIYFTDNTTDADWGGSFYGVGGSGRYYGAGGGGGWVGHAGGGGAHGVVIIDITY